jgi:hypothetical protein
VSKRMSFVPLYSANFEITDRAVIDVAATERASSSISVIVKLRLSPARTLRCCCCLHSE